jgi:hypothetical protein
MRRISIAATAFAAMLVWAPGAAASTVIDNGSEFSVLAGAGEANGIVVTVTGTSATVTDSAGVGVGSPAGSCTPNPPNEVNCANVLPGSGRVIVTAGDLNDTVTLSVPPVALPDVRTVLADGGAGNDTIDASGSGLLGHQLAGSEGDDTIIGGPFGDILNRPVFATGPLDIAAIDDPGNDRVTGGGGDDLIGAKSGADVVDAGEGYDLVETLPAGPNSTTAAIDIQDDRAIDTVSCGGNTPAPGSFPRPPSAQLDAASVGQGDIVSSDCEALSQFIECPPGATCAGSVSVEAPAASASSALASAAGKKKGKKKPLVLGKRKIKIKPGTSTTFNVNLRGSKVNRALGKAAQTAATMRFNMKRVKKGRQVGKLRKRVRFKLKR